MRGTSVIKEFLLSLGWKVDETGQQKFSNTVTKATKEVKALGEATSGTVVAIAEMVTRVGRYYEDLYYLSQRTNSSLLQLQSWSYGAKQIGLSADSARAAVEGLAQSMRLSPGIGAMLNGLGVSTQGRGSTQILNDVLVRLKTLFPTSYYVAAGYAQALGIPEDVLQQFWNNPRRFMQAQQDSANRQRAAGIGGQDQTESWNRFWTSLNRVEDEFGILEQRVATDWLPVAQKVVDVVEAITEGFVQMDVATHGAMGYLGTIATGAMGAWLVKAILMRTVLKGIAADAAAAAGAGEGAAAVAGGSAAAAGGIGLLSIAGIAAAVAGLIATIWPQQLNAGEDERARQKALGGGTGGGAGNTLGERNNNPGNIMRRGRELNFPGASQGMQAMASLLVRYGNRWGWNTLSQIVSHWAPPNENDTNSYLSDVSKRTGFGINQVLNLSDPGTLQKVMDAMINHEQGGNPWGIGQEKLAINAVLGGGGVDGAPGAAGRGGVQITQKTDITINGSSDPKAAADAVVGAQTRVNNDLVRNFVPVIQ